MSRKLEPGDVVMLKSGGPRMTVKSKSPHETDSWLCVWFAGDKTQEEVFPEVVLKEDGS